MTADPASPAPALHPPHPRRWGAAAVLVVAALMDLLDVTIVNVALPTIQRDLGADPTELEWTSAAYLLAFAAALITTARMGDLWGRRRVFLAAVAAFGLASLWCGLAQTATELVAARAVQGVAAAGISAQVLSTLQSVFHGRERGTVFGLFGIVAGVAQALGLLLGGVLVTADVAGLGWRTIFLVNVPVAALLIGFGLRLVPETRAPGAGRPNLLAVGVLTAGLVAVVVPLLEGHYNGWPLWGWFCLAGGVVAIVALAFAERRHDAPLLPAGLFRLHAFSTGIVVQMVAYAGLSGFLLVFAVWLQDGQGYSPLLAGLVTVAFSAGSLVTGPVAGRLTFRFGRLTVMAGCTLFAAGALGVLTAATASPGEVGPWSLVPGLLLLGAGINLIMPPLGLLMFAAVPPQYAGSASGISTTSQQFGGALGVAALGAVFFSTLATGGYGQAFTATAIATAAALVACAALCLTLTRRPVMEH